VPSDSFDIVFSKSVVEHLHNPLPYLESMLAALKPGGVAMILTPSWLHHGWGPFYLDHTHVTPFTAPSLDDAVTIAGFEQVRVEHFRQLPFLWRWPALTLPVRLFAKLPLPYAPMHPGAWKWPTGFNKFIRFSKEVMLLASARKPTRAI
jgi:SAM-dependent methyltransferase